MKKIDFTQVGGFPLDQESLAFMQQATNEVLKALIGHFNIGAVGAFIISGCENDEAYIYRGIMYIDGDLCFFAGEAATNGLETPIGKVLNTIDAPFESGPNYPIYMDYVAAVDPASKYLWNEIVRVPQVKEFNWTNIINPPQFIIDPYNPTAIPAQKTVLQRLDLLEAQNKIFQTGGGIFHWGKPIAEIPPGFAPILDAEGRILVNIDRRQNSLGQYINPEFAPLPGDLPGRKNGTLTKATLTKENLPNSHGVNIYGLKVDGLGTVNSADEGGDDQPNLSLGKLIIPANANQPFSILPPTMTCEYIEWVGL